MAFSDAFKELLDVDCRSVCVGSGSLEGRGMLEREDAQGDLFTSAMLRNNFFAALKLRK